jgi:SpoVK/Ycf46/Vps4 family AAA+-type ATPase
MVCKAAAATYPELPFLYVGDIGRRSCTAEIEQVFQHARQSAPCILAFEDMDGLVDRANRTVFLNELDGFRDNEGLLIIASSNHPERIDEAILKRPSRFDRVYHIGLPARPERIAYTRLLLERAPNLSPSLDVEALAEKVADVTEGFTPAFLKEAYLSAVLQLAHEGLWELDEAFGAALLEQTDFLRRYLKKAKNPEAMADMLASSGTGENIGFRSR